MAGEITGVTAIARNYGHLWAIRAGRVHPLNLESGGLRLGAAVEGVREAVEVVGYDTNVCARTRAGEVWCWGRNESSQLGRVYGPLRLTFTALPTRVGQPFTPISTECGVSHADSDDDYDSDY